MKRNRTCPAVIAYGLYLYFSSRSYRCASKCLESIVKRSHVSIWKWIQKYSDCADIFQTNKRAVKEIFVDETLLKIDGQDYWLWIAYEPHLSVCLAMHLSRERTIFICYQFFKHLRRRYGRKLIYTDGARWYNDACRWLRLRHIIYGNKMKNLMERFLYNRLRIEQNVSMTIFLVEEEEKRIVIGSICMELVEIICTVLAYGNGQNTLHDILGDRGRLS